MDRGELMAVITAYTGDCRCDPAYSERRLRDPECSYHYVDAEGLADDLMDLVSENKSKPSA